MLVFKNANYLTPDKDFNIGDVVVNGGEIVFVGENFKEHKDDTILDLEGKYLIPGLVDVHTHGAMGIDSSLASTDELCEMTKYYAENGVTSFMPTTMTAEFDEIVKAFKNIVEASKKSPGSTIIGIHAEGPYISKKQAGCHKLSLIKNPDIKEAEQLLAILGDKLLLRETVAPELSGATDFISFLTKKGHTVTLGHSDATADKVTESLKAGANCFTHTFNAMRGLHHREPGVVGIALSNDDAYCELICDGIHVNPTVVSILCRAKTPKKVILITDSMPATGLSDREIIFGGVNVIVKDGIARTEDGTLAGSTLHLLDGVKNFSKFANISFAQAIRCASINPAAAIGLDNVIGSIEVGKRADLVVLDKDKNISETFCKGKKVF